MRDAESELEAKQASCPKLRWMSRGIKTCTWESKEWLKVWNNVNLVRVFSFKLRDS